jgi:hypothetical protein
MTTYVDRLRRRIHTHYYTLLHLRVRNVSRAQDLMGVQET